MKRLLLITILISTTRAITLGQDKDLEARLYGERIKIKESKIKEITERVSQYWKRPCNRDSAEIRFKYEFNDKGDLIRTDEFHRGHFWKTTKYVRNKKGDYIQKSYNFYDSLDSIRRVDNWFFEFNKKGQKVLEVWVSEKDTVRTNKLSYDKRGNYIEQFTDGWLKWRFKYDHNNKIIESDQCRLQGDSMQCHSLTKYEYENGLLKRQVLYAKDNNIWKEFDYAYDSRQILIEIKEQWHTLVKRGSEPWKTEVRVTIIKFENDDKGNCIVKSEYSDNDDMAFRCTYYDYKYY